MRRIFAHAWRAGVVVCALGSMDLYAAESTSREALTLQQAIALAAERNPLARASASESESLASRSEIEALPPAWTFETEFENFAGTGNVSGVDALESTVQLSRVIERGGKLALRKELGAREFDALAADQQVRRAELSAEVARRFIHVVADQQSLTTAHRATELSRTARDVVKERVTAGAASPAMLSRAEIALARAKIAQEHAEHELASSRVNLSVLWGDSRAAFGTAAGAIFELSALEPLEVYTQRLEASPDIARFGFDSQAQDADRKSVV